MSCQENPVNSCVPTEKKLHEIEVTLQQHVHSIYHHINKNLRGSLKNKTTKHTTAVAKHKEKN
jgi:hypothetical protein